MSSFKEAFSEHLICFLTAQFLLFIVLITQRVSHSTYYNSVILFVCLLICCLFLFSSTVFPTIIFCYEGRELVWLIQDRLNKWKKERLNSAALDFDLLSGIRICIELKTKTLSLIGRVWNLGFYSLGNCEQVIKF